MGHITKILGERETGGGIYEDVARIEIEESIHFHYRDLRLSLAKEDFLSLCKVFREAEESYNKLGQPETTQEMHGLAVEPLTTGISHNRVGVEHQIDNTIHIHYKDLRMHFSAADFLYFSALIENSFLNFPDLYLQEINITDCFYHEVVAEHLEDLKNYKEGKYEKVEAENFIELKNEIINHCSSVGVYSERTLGFPKEYPRPVSRDLDRKYLFSIYESIKKYGYAEGPFLNNYIVAYETDNGIYLTGAHRVASLLSLGYNKIKVYLVKPESGWRTK